MIVDVSRNKNFTSFSQVCAVLGHTPKTVEKAVDALKVRPVLLNRTMHFSDRQVARLAKHLNKGQASA